MSATIWTIVPAPDDDDVCGSVGGISGRGNRSTRKNPVPVPRCTPQIPHDLGWNSDHQGEKPTTNRLSYGTAYGITLLGAHARISSH
jgi:hypothetical protein